MTAGFAPCLRILMTSDAVGGVFSYAVTLAEALCVAGHAVTLVVQGPPPDESKRATLRAVRGLDVIETDFELEWRDPQGRDAVRARYELLRIAERVRPDIIHLNSFREALAGFPCPVVITAHSCVATWWRACRGGQPDGSWDRYIREVRAALDAADAWIAPSRTFGGMMEAVYAPRTSCRVVHNGTSSLIPGSSARRVALSAGRMWDEAKDLATLVRAADSVECPVEIAGALRTPGGASAPESGAAKFLGEAPHGDLLALMAEAAIFVSSAVYEPFGLSVLEAAASGCVLVLSDIPSFRELWDGVALFFEPRNSDHLAREINRLNADIGLRASLRARSLDRAARYDAGAMLRGTFDVYRSVLNGSRYRPADTRLIA